MTGVTWDRPNVHGQFAGLLVRRFRFRLARTLGRFRSGRRMLATGLAGLFLLAYALCGIFILATRLPADPERLRLWLSGGMAIYLLYHLVRCVWTDKVADLELTSAESLWLGGAPARRSSLAVYHVAGVVPESVLKSLLLTVILARDVHHVELLVVGLVASLVLLQVARLIVVRIISGFNSQQLAWARFFATLVAAALVVQVLARLIESTPFGSPIPMFVTATFHSLGATAASDTVQWLSIAWWPASQIITTENYGWNTIPLLMETIAVVPIAIIVLVHADAWVTRMQVEKERRRLAREEFKTNGENRFDASELTARLRNSFLIANVLPRSVHDLAVLVDRQLITAKRYRSTILFSFAVPTLLCLSPLATGQIRQQWVFVVGGIALCTMLLAPPALQIDFRRDLKRMLLLRSLPIRPRSMVLGQLAVPVAVTLAFQWLTIGIAAIVAQPGWLQTIMWAGMLNALAVFTFAAENALFLTFPHHTHHQGMAMMIRAKLVFLGKVIVMLGSLTMLLAWIVACGNMFHDSIRGPVIIGVPVLVSWAFRGNRNRRNHGPIVVRCAGTETFRLGTRYPTAVARGRFVETRVRIRTTGALRDPWLPSCNRFAVTRISTRFVDSKSVGKQQDATSRLRLQVFWDSQPFTQQMLQ